MGVPAEMIEKARDADLVALVQRYGVTLRRGAAGKFTGACPVCGAAGFAINVKSRAWSCQRCGAGNAIALVQRVEKYGFADAVRKLGAQA